MATRLTYSVREINTSLDLSQEDLNLIPTFTVNTSLDYQRDRVDITIYSLNERQLDFLENFTAYRVSSNRLSSANEVTLLELDPVDDVQELGYNNGDVLINYDFLRDLFTGTKEREEFFIKEISGDRTELLLSPINDNLELAVKVNLLKESIDNNSLVYFYRINLGNGQYVNFTNIELFSEEAKLIAVKLYAPLPNSIGIKTRVSLDEKIIDSRKYEITAESTFIADPTPVLRGPNFNLPIGDDISNPTELLSTENLLSEVTQSNYEIYSLFNEKGITLSLDHTDFSNFIHFSSAEERLRNFKYKLQLIESYESLKTQSTGFAQETTNFSASLDYYNNLITGVVDNFDHYDRFLYYTSGSFSWPKSNSTQPFINAHTTSSEAEQFFDSLIISASDYDVSNTSRLINTLPSFIKDDPNNDSFKLFLDMIGHHFDNIWIYSQAITDKYDNDNRLTSGISKDLVADALKNFGITLYGNNSSLESLFSVYTGENYITGSEVINTFISASNRPTSKDAYQKEVYKRIYHNLPLLLKSKGTEKGVRALVNSFGIPYSILDINYYGGIGIDDTPYFGPLDSYSGSINRIRIDNTGSILTGETLSDLTSIVKESSKYSQDLHNLDIGFSPTTYINSYLSGSVSSSFDIDNYIGDPGYAYSSSYQSLDSLLETFAVTGSIERYDVNDFIRLAKFYNNSLFKMLKDFVPARANLNTGVIIKPNILDRSKVKQVELSTEQPEYSGSIEIVTVSGSDGNIFTTATTGSGEYSTNYSYDIILSSGSISTINKTHEEAKYDGELSGSELSISDGELNRANTYKANNPTPYSYVIRPVTEPPLDLRIAGVVSHISP